MILHSRVLRNAQSSLKFVDNFFLFIRRHVSIQWEHLCFSRRRERLPGVAQFSRWRKIFAGRGGDFLRVLAINFDTQSRWLTHEIIHHFDYAPSLLEI